MNVYETVMGNKNGQITSYEYAVAVSSLMLLAVFYVSLCVLCVCVDNSEQ